MALSIYGQMFPKKSSFEILINTGWEFAMILINEPFPEI